MSRRNHQIEELQKKVAELSAENQAILATLHEHETIARDALDKVGKAAAEQIEAMATDLTHALTLLRQTTPPAQELIEGLVVEVARQDADGSDDSFLASDLTAYAAATSKLYEVWREMRDLDRQATYADALLTGNQYAYWKATNGRIMWLAAFLIRWLERRKGMEPFSQEIADIAPTYAGVIDRQSKQEDNSDAGS